MKRFVTLNLIQDNVPERIWTKLLRILDSDLAHKGLIRCRLEGNDLRLSEATELLDTAGKIVHSEGKPLPNHHIVVRYEYEASDLARADYFVVGEYPAMALSKRWDDGHWGVQIDDEQAHPMGSPSGDFAGLGPCYGVVISPEFQLILDAANLVGPVFRETVPFVAGEFGSGRTEVTWEESSHGPWIEMDTAIQLPPLHSKIRLMNANNGKPMRRGENQHRVVIEEGPWPRVELHYLKHEIKEVGPFDLARTCESFFNPKGYESPGKLVFSRRIYELCESRGIKIEWWPVFLEDE